MNENLAPATGVGKAQILAQVTAMVNKRAKNATETKKMLSELESKIRRAEEISGKRIDEGYERSVIVGIVDEETMKHSAGWTDKKTSVHDYKKKILEFTNLFRRGDEQAMDLGRVEEEEG